MAGDETLFELLFDSETEEEFFGYTDADLSRDRLERRHCELESESGDSDSESASGVDISASAPDGYDHQWLPSALESRVVDRWQYIYGDCLLIPV